MPVGIVTCAWVRRPCLIRVISPTVDGSNPGGGGPSGAPSSTCETYTVPLARTATPVGEVNRFQTCWTFPVRALSLYTRPAFGASAPRKLTYTLRPRTWTPVATGSHPLVPGLALASGRWHAFVSLNVL